MVKLSRIDQSLFDFYFCSIGKGGAAENEIIENGGNAICLNVNHRIGRLGTFLKVVSMIRKIKPDVIHCSGAEAIFYGVLAGRLLNIKNVIAEEIGIPAPSSLTRKVFRLVYALAHKVVGESVVVCEAISRAYCVDQKKLNVVYNFIDCPALVSYNKKKSDCIHLLSVCRLEPIKNLIGVIAALSVLKDEGYNFIYSIVGNGRDFENLSVFARDVGLNKNVIFHGYNPDPSEYYKSADLFIMNSYSEGFSNSLLEAMCFRVPVISTKVGGAVDVLINDINGWLVDVDDVDGLIEALRHIFQLPISERVAVGDRGNDDVRRYFSCQEHTAALSALYDLQ